MPLLAIAANDIDTSGRDFEADLPPGWLAEELSDADLTSEKPGHVKARLSRTGDDIVVRGRVTADLRTPCARCLGPTAIQVEGELSLLLRPQASAGPHHQHEADRKKANGKGHGDKAKAVEDEYEFTSEEADFDAYDGETVVLDPFVREAILLEIPNFPLCSEDCPGIRPAAAESAEQPEAPRIDPRLAPLDALRAKLAGERPSGPQAEPTKTKKQKKNAKE
ncbi:MAG: DUF177 domain-containing protein [Byssovorax sp.]